jgi:hypothetical protein
VYILTSALLVLAQLGVTAEAAGKMQGTLAWAAPELLAGAAADAKVHIHLPCLTGCGTFGHADANDTSWELHAVDVLA